MFSMQEFQKVNINQGQKLISALHELSKENFSVSDDTILDKLYVYIESSVEIKDHIHSLWSEIGDWLETVVNEWKGEQLFYGVKIFVLRFVGYVGTSSEGFNVLKSKNVLSHIQELASNAHIQNDPSLMVPFINILGMFLKHEDGRIWVTETMMWKYIVTAYYEDRSIYIKRASVKFMSLLLSTFDNHDVGKDMLCFVCEPLIINHLLVVQKTTDQVDVLNDSSDETQVFNGGKVIVTTQLSKAAKYICDVLQELLSADATMPGKISLVLRTNGNDKESVLISDILKSDTSLQEIETFSLLQLLLDLSNAIRKDKSGLFCNTCQLDPVYHRIESVLSTLVAQNQFLAIINFCVTSLSWRAKILKSLKSVRPHVEWEGSDWCNELCSSCVHFERLVLCCLRVFLNLHICCVENVFSCKADRYPRCRFEHVLEQDLYAKITKACSVDKTAELLCFQYIQSAIFGLIKSFPYFKSRLNVSNIFKNVLYTIHTTLNCIEETIPDNAKPTILHLLSLASKIIEEHRLPFMNTRKESDKNLYLLIIRILDMTILDVRVTVSSLQILSKVLKFHIMPDLFCMVENNSTSDIDLTSSDNDVRLELSRLSLLMSKLKSDSWEVRDTALEVYQTIIELANLTPWYFLNPFKPDLLNCILETAISDESSYVRASAFNFFSRSVRAKFFENIISPTTLCDAAIQVLLDDNMPVARKAACELVTALYITYVPHVVSEANRMYEAVFVTTTRDLDWEVKKAAQQFWRCVIEKHLLEENVPLSSSLPSFAKIPTTDNGIVSRIRNVFNKLGEIGCLKAIWLGVKDDCDIKVSQEARSIVDYIEELNRHWNFVEDIINQSDIAGPSKVTGPSKHMNAKEFGYLLENREWRDTLDSRRDWIENACDDLTSLLDHILDVENNRIDDWDHNMLDCY